MEYPYRVNLWTVNPQLDLICFTSGHQQPIVDLYFCSETLLVSLSYSSDGSTHVEIFDCLLKKSVLLKRISSSKLLTSFFFSRHKESIQKESTFIKRMKKQKRSDPKEELVSKIQMRTIETDPLKPSLGQAKSVEKEQNVWDKIKFPDYFYKPLESKGARARPKAYEVEAKDLFFVTLNRDSLQIWLFSNNGLRLKQHFEVSEDNQENLSSVCLYHFGIGDEQMFDFLVGTCQGNIYMFVDNDFLLLKPSAHEAEIHLMQTLSLYSHVSDALTTEQPGADRLQGPAFQNLERRVRLDVQVLAGRRGHIPEPALPEPGHQLLPRVAAQLPGRRV